MESVGVRELKNLLSHYLRAVRQGRIIEVTARGKPIARLVPASPQREHCQQVWKSDCGNWTPKDF